MPDGFSTGTIEMLGIKQGQRVALRRDQRDGGGGGSVEFLVYVRLSGYFMLGVACKSIVIITGSIIKL